ncbi:hypothetical protein C8Q80DRAFT_1273846 [Daedaleopsis nitida]|nr:hypothetical protein C8Q80DRAFT_1273846 [Daedaleopsis nitida]
MLSTWTGLIFALSVAISAFGLPDGLTPSRTTVDLAAHFNPIDIVTRPIAMNPAIPLTNAQRLAQGLPLNRPRSHYGARGALHPRQSSTCVMRTGRISVWVDGSYTGYLSRLPNSFGEYTPATDATDAMSVTLCTESETGYVDIIALNGPSVYPYVGGVVGFASSSDNLGAALGTNYVYIAATTQGTSSLISLPIFQRGPAVSGPNAYSAATGLDRHIESAIWQIADNDQLSVSWVNSDGSLPAVQLLYVPSAKAFAITADPVGFQANFGTAQAAIFKFVDVQSAPTISEA